VFDARGTAHCDQVVLGLRLRDRDAPPGAREAERERVRHLLGAVDQPHVAVEEQSVHSRW